MAATRIKLRTLITLLFTTLIIVSVSTVSWLSHRGVRETVNYLAYDLQARSLESVSQHLNTLLGRPGAINGVNLGAASSGILNTGDQEAAARHFWKMGEIFPNIGTIAFADEEGNFVGANRPEDYYVLSHHRLTGGSINRYSTETHKPFTGKILSSKPGYDARNRGWYKEAAQSQNPLWTEISLAVTTRRLDLTAVSPWWENGRLRGVFMVDLPLGRIGEFLKDLEIAKSGKIFIVDKQGMLVAASDCQPFYEDAKTGELTRTEAAKSPDPLIAAIAGEIGKKGKRLGIPGSKIKSKIEVGQVSHLVTMSPFIKTGGIEWTVVLTVPEKTIFGAFERNTAAVMRFGFLVVMATLFAAAFIAWRITKPLSALNEAAKELARGGFKNPQMIHTGRKDELGELTKTFNHMASQLETSMERLRNEKEISSRQAAELIESERRNNALFAAMPDVLIVCDNNGILAEVRGYCGGPLGGRSAEELRGIDIASFMPEGVGENLKYLVRKALGEGNVQSLKFIAAQGGETRHYEARIVAGGPNETLILCRDMTSEKQAEEESQILKARLTEAQKMEAIGTLAGGVAHDFNNLLQVVSGRIELLKNHVTDERGLESVEIIEKSVDRAASLVQGLLTFAHKAEQTRKPVDLNEEIHFTAQMIERTIPKMVEVRFELADNLPKVMADVNQLQQIMLNLVANARDAMPDGGILTISTGLGDPGQEFFRDNPKASRGGYVTLSVADTGTGIAAEHAGRVFDPFFTTKEVGKGTGLGLSIVYGITRDHGGHVTLKSEAGHGARFTIFLPATDMESVKERVEGPVTLNTGKTLRTVLIVDDEVEIGAMMSEGLKSFGLNTLTAQSGEECLEIHSKMAGGIDLIILDMGMPGMGGKACLMELRKTDREVKVIIASGYGPQAGEETEGQADGFIAKPYRMADLIRKINQLF